MRTFIAVNIPLTPELKKLCQHIKANLRLVQIKYTDPESYHITLSFLGETSSEQVKSMVEELEILVLSLPSFDLNLSGTGLFNSNAVPRVWWADINYSLPLLDLWKQVNEIAKKNGFITNTTNFEPHVTLGKIKNIGLNNNLYEIIGNYQKSNFGRIKISDFILYQSIRSPDGAKYKIIKKFSLKK